LTETVAFERVKPWARQKLQNRQIVGGFDFGEPPLDESCPSWAELVQFLGLGQLLAKFLFLNDIRMRSGLSSLINLLGKTNCRQC